MIRLVGILSVCLLSCQSGALKPEQKTVQQTEVLVIGDGTGAVASAIQSARSGSETILITTLPWLGGMLTSAGVSAVDGNHEMPAGIYGEFKEALKKHYGGAENLATGWVSHTLFEPAVGDSIFKAIVSQEALLKVYYESHYDSLYFENGMWQCSLPTKIIKSPILVDGTDLGDIAHDVGCAYDTGLDAEGIIEKMHSKSLIQDFTYTAVLKKYETAQKIEKPIDYESYDFSCACDSLCSDSLLKTHPCTTMLSYAQLPNQKYLINWPLNGNDYYADLLKLNSQERKAVYEKAKAKTKAFVYFINHDLGFTNLNLADDEFPTVDKLPFMPYHREGRRIIGLARMEISHVENPYSSKLYRTGIAVGDYPIDHHHKEHAFEIDKDFVAVPSFNVPLACLIPEDINQFLIADKAISVSHVVNGTTRLQPVILQIGQASGIIAALSAQQKLDPQNIRVRDVQKQVLKGNGYIMPTYDVNPNDIHFKAIQRISACGILRLIGEPYKWANRSWFYPEKALDFSDLKEHIKDYKLIKSTLSHMTTTDFEDIFDVTITSTICEDLKLDALKRDQLLTRRSFAVLYDYYFNPFDREIDMNGHLIR